MTIPSGALRKNTKIFVPSETPQISIDLEAGTDPDAVLLAASCKLGPSGTRFSKPATVEMKISREALKRVQKGDRLLVASVTGDVVEYITDYRLDSQGNVRFQVNHFCYFVTLVLGTKIVAGVLGTIIVAGSVLYTLNPRIEEMTYNMTVTPDGSLRIESITYGPPKEPEEATVEPAPPKEPGESVKPSQPLGSYLGFIRKEYKDALDEDHIPYKGERKYSGTKIIFEFPGPGNINFSFVYHNSEKCSLRYVPEGDRAYSFISWSSPAKGVLKRGPGSVRGGMLYRWKDKELVFNSKTDKGVGTFFVEKAGTVVFTAYPESTPARKYEGGWSDNRYRATHNHYHGGSFVLKLKFHGMIPYR